MPRKPTRREFLQRSTAAGIGFWVAGRALGDEQPKSANDKLNIAVIGTMGQGEWNRGQLVEAGENIVALADVDEKWSGKAREACPKAKFYTDYRHIFDDKSIDAVLIATPDHSHALPTVMALRAGKHVYCEKPLCHTVAEVRLVTELAAKTGLATQMGTQIHARSNYRRVVEAIQTHTIGFVNEVHVWCHKQWSGEPVTESPPVPEGLHYDLWLGGAKERPYSPKYLPMNWRGWWDFGGGTLADMACHHMDLSFWALDLKYPLSVEATGPAVHPQVCPPTLKVRYEFPARGKQPPVTLTWYHGGELPPQFADESLKMPKWGAGTLFVGAKGMLLADYDKHLLFPEEAFKQARRHSPFIPDSIGHHREWIRWCKGGDKSLCRFDYAGPLTEAVLLGNVAFRTGKKLEWDAASLKAGNAPEAGKFIRKEYRKGWEVV